MGIIIDKPDPVVLSLYADFISATNTIIYLFSCSISALRGDDTHYIKCNTQKLSIFNIMILLHIIVDNDDKNELQTYQTLFIINNKSIYTCS